MLAGNEFGCMELYNINFFDCILVGAVVQPHEPRCLSNFQCQEAEQGLLSLF